MHEMPTVTIETHGCKLNTADSITMAANFMASGFDVAAESAGGSDVFVLNSCTVTHVADKKARQRVSAVRRLNPSSMIVVAGCYPTRDLETVAALDVVDLVIPNAAKSAIVEQVSAAIGHDGLPLGSPRARQNPAAVLGRTRAALKIQEGCDQACAYCIVPKVRGRERSVPVDALVRQANELHEQGCSEVVLTGTQLGHYGFDLPPGRGNDLPSMLRTLLRETDIPRIRVSSLQAPEINDALLDVWATVGRSRLCPHFHIPLQSGSDAVLTRMRRTYKSAEFMNAVQRVRAAIPSSSITTDVIAGFPGESDGDHAASVRVMRQVGFSDAHVFPYSRRPGTSADHYDGQLSHHVKAVRAAALRQVAETSARRYRESEVGKVREVLWESGLNATGLTENYLRVKSSSGQLGKDADGTFEMVRLAGVRPDGTMECEPLPGQ